MALTWSNVTYPLNIHCKYAMSPTSLNYCGIYFSFGIKTFLMPFMVDIKSLGTQISLVYFLLSCFLTLWTTTLLFFFSTLIPLNPCYYLPPLPCLFASHWLSGPKKLIKSSTKNVNSQVENKLLGYFHAIISSNKEQGNGDNL